MLQSQHHEAFLNIIMRPFLYIISFLVIIPVLQAQIKDPLLEVRVLLLNENFEEVLFFTDSLASFTGNLTDGIPEVSGFPDSLRLDSIKAVISYYRGQAFRELARYDSALHYFQLAVSEDSSNLSYRKAEGQAYNRLGRTADAIRVYEEIISVDSADIKSRLDLASLYMIRNKYGKSLNLYLQLLQSDSVNYFLYKQAGRCLIETSRADTALYFLEKAFELNPADPWLTQQIANMYLRKKDMDSSLATMQKGIVHDSTNADLLRLRGYIWFIFGNYIMAINDFEASALGDSTSVFTYKYMGLAQFEEKRFADSRHTLTRAFKLDSLDAEIAFFLGSACRWSGYEEEAVGHYLKSIELLKPMPGQMKNFHIELAELYKVLHRFDLALESFHDALSYDSTDNVIIYKIAQVYDHNLNKKSEAIKYYEIYLDGLVTDQVLYDTKNRKVESLLEHVQGRINQLKEEMFFTE